MSRGAILVDGVDLRHLELAALRRQFSVVLQDVFLFNRSLRDNLTLGNPAIRMVSDKILLCRQS